MNRADGFHFTPLTQEALVTVLQRIVDEGLIGQRVLLEHGVFEIDSTTFSEGPPLEAVLYLGDGASLIVRDELAPYVRLTLPEGYLKQLDAARSGPRRLYWASPIPPLGLGDPPQNPHGIGDMTLYVPESLEAAYSRTREAGGGDDSYQARYALEVWEGYEPSEAGRSPLRPALSEGVLQPPHYTWLGKSLAELGLSDVANVEAWDVLDAAFPNNPHLWNAGKYLLRLGRKGGEAKRLEDLRKARQYLDRAIERLEESKNV